MTKSQFGTTKAYAHTYRLYQHWPTGKNNKEPRYVCHSWERTKNVQKCSYSCFFGHDVKHHSKKEELFFSHVHSTPYILPHITLIYLVNYDDMPIGHMMNRSGWKKGTFFISSDNRWWEWNEEITQKMGETSCTSNVLLYIHFLHHRRLTACSLLPLNAILPLLRVF